MPRFSDSESIRLIATINDSTLLNWKHRCNPQAQIQFPKSPELPPLEHTMQELFNSAKAIGLIMKMNLEETSDGRP